VASSLRREKKAEGVGASLMVELLFCLVFTTEHDALYARLRKVVK